MVTYGGACRAFPLNDDGSSDSGRSLLASEAEVVDAIPAPLAHASTTALSDTTIPNVRFSRAVRSSAAPTFWVAITEGEGVHIVRSSH